MSDLLCDAEVESFYKAPSQEEWVEASRSLLKKFNDFLAAAGYPEDLEFVIRKGDVSDITLRVDKRNAYFSIFHGIRISELKMAALYAYWILKFHPVTITDSRYVSNQDALLVNEHFAAYLIIAVVFSDYIAEQRDPENDENLYDLVTHAQFYEKLLYSFRYRNISIDSMILLAETITVDSFKQRFTK